MKKAGREYYLGSISISSTQVPCVVGCNTVIGKCHTRLYASFDCSFPSRFSNCRTTVTSSAVRYKSSSGTNYPTYDNSDSPHGTRRSLTPTDNVLTLICLSYICQAIRLTERPRRLRHISTTQNRTGHRTSEKSSADPDTNHPTCLPNQKTKRLRKRSLLMTRPLA